MQGTGNRERLAVANDTHDCSSLLSSSCDSSHQERISCYAEGMKEKHYEKQLPMKRMASAALFLNEEYEILIVEPLYRENWLLPGGIIEDGESPRQACIREVKEELGLHIDARKLLCVDYKKQQGTRKEGIEFVFFGGILERKTIQQIQLQADELKKSLFARKEKALKLLNPWSSRRLPWIIWALEEETTVYLEDGEKLD
jgi:8-oxo-dGTP diphosphatase